MASIHAQNPLIRVMEGQDAAMFAPLLADDVRFSSPIVTRPIRGREQVADLLAAVMDAYDDWECVRETNVADRSVLETVATVRGHRVEVIDVVRYDDEGLITDLTVAARPLVGVAWIAAAVGPALLSRQRPGAGRVLGWFATALPALLAWIDWFGSRAVVGTSPRTRP